MLYLKCNSFTTVKSERLQTHRGDRQTTKKNEVRNIPDQRFNMHNSLPYVRSNSSHENIQLNSSVLKMLLSLQVPDGLGR